MIIECPECGSGYFDVHDTETNYHDGIHWDYCYCEECGANFYVEYKAVEIVICED